MQIVDVDRATAHMYGTKVEIIMPKAEPGSWSNLSFPKTVLAPPVSKEAAKPQPPAKSDSDSSDVDLDDLEPVRGPVITETS